MKMNVSIAKLLACTLVFALFSCTSDDDNNGGGDPKNSFTSCGGYDYIEDVPERTYEGVLCISDFSVEEGSVQLNYEKIEYKYYFSTFFGEAIHRGYIRWNGNVGSNDINLITIRAEVFDLDGDFTGYYYFYKPIFGDIEDDWSIDVSGSPAWNKIFTTDPDGTDFLSEQATKNIFINGFYLSNLYPFQINSKKYNYQ